MAQFRDQELLNKIARRLKHLREDKGLSQEQVYNETDIHIARIELGKINITVSTLSKLCIHYEVSLTAFFSQMNGVYE